MHRACTAPGFASVFQCFTKTLDSKPGVQLESLLGSAHTVGDLMRMLNICSLLDGDIDDA